MAVNHYSDESPKRTQIPAGYDEDPNEITISFRNVWRALLRKWWIVFLCTLLGGLGGFFLAKNVLTPQYKIKSLIYLQPDEVLVDENGKIGTFEKKIINNAMYIVENQELFEKMAQIAHLENTRQVKENLELLAYGEADMLEINITGKTAQEAYDLSQAFVNGAVELLKKEIPYAIPAIIQEPVMPEKPSGPSTILITAAGAMAGFVLSFLGLMIYGLRDHRINTKEEAEDFFGKPVYAALPVPKGR